MAIQLILQFPGQGADKYDEVMGYLGLHGPGNREGDNDWPDGIISHTAGASDDGWCVVDVWESQEAFNAFFGSRLEPALQKAAMPQPDIITASVYNRYPGVAS